MQDEIIRETNNQTRNTIFISGTILRTLQSPLRTAVVQAVSVTLRKKNACFCMCNFSVPTCKQLKMTKHKEAIKLPYFLNNALIHQKMSIFCLSHPVPTIEILSRYIVILCGI